MPRDHAAELLSIVRSAYASGYKDGNSAVIPSSTEAMIARAETRAAEYVEARELNEQHPLAILVAQLTASQSTARNEVTEEAAGPWNLWRRAYSHSWTVCHGHAAVARMIGTSDTADAYAHTIVEACNTHSTLLSRLDALRAVLIDAEALLCDERAGPAANELAAKARALLGDCPPRAA